MKKFKVFITRKIYQEAEDQISELAEVETWPYDTVPSQDVLAAKAAEVDGMLTMLTDPIRTQVITEGANHHLKVISQMAVGFDNIDVGTATSRHIPVGFTPGVLTETTADFAWALMMAAARRVAEADHEVHQGIWRPWGPSVLCGSDLYGATLGIVGFGRIGQAVAHRAKGFNMRILYSGPHRKPEIEEETGAQYVQLNTLLQESDFISLHAYLSSETRGLIGREQIALMKPTSILINTARGPIIQTEALEEAMLHHQIAAAALDVYDPEPIPDDSPLLQMKNVLITPHIASASTSTRQTMARMCAENIIAGLKGERLPNCANLQVYGD